MRSVVTPIAQVTPSVRVIATVLIRRDRTQTLLYFSITVGPAQNRSSPDEAKFMGNYGRAPNSKEYYCSRVRRHKYQLLAEPRGFCLCGGRSWAARSDDHDDHNNQAAGCFQSHLHGEQMKYREGAGLVMGR